MALQYDFKDLPWLATWIGIYYKCRYLIAQNILKLFPYYIMATLKHYKLANSKTKILLAYFSSYIVMK